MTIFFKSINEGDTIQLANQEVEVIKCNECDHLMVNIDADQLSPGDLTLLKSYRVRISNPTTEDEVCVNCDPVERTSFVEKLGSWFDDDDDDDDSGFFSSPSSSSSGSFGGGSFGGFGGGMFSGGGASRSF
jgi:uncharacterized membrane protein YgcG